MADINAGDKILLTKNNLISSEEDEAKKEMARRAFSERDKIEAQEKEIKRLNEEIEELKKKLNRKR